MFCSNRDYYGIVPDSKGSQSFQFLEALMIHQRKWNYHQNWCLSASQGIGMKPVSGVALKVACIRSRQGPEGFTLPARLGRNSYFYWAPTGAGASHQSSPFIPQNDHMWWVELCLFYRWRKRRGKRRWLAKENPADLLAMESDLEADPHSLPLHASDPWSLGFPETSFFRWWQRTGIFIHCGKMLTACLESQTLFPDPKGLAHFTTRLGPRRFWLFAGGSKGAS